MKKNTVNVISGTVSVRTNPIAINIEAVEYNDFQNGNSYFDGVITIDYGQDVKIIMDMPLQYGYENHYKDMAFKQLKKNGIIDTDLQSYDQYYKNNGIVIKHSKKTGCIYSQRKKQG